MQKFSREEGAHCCFFKLQKNCSLWNLFTCTTHNGFPLNFLGEDFILRSNLAFFGLFYRTTTPPDPSLPNGKKRFFRYENSRSVRIFFLILPKKSPSPACFEDYKVNSYWKLWNTHTVLHSFLPFDSCLGFPGEGPKRKFWNKTDKMFSMACYNPRSLTYERFCYLKSLEIDVLGLTELWHNMDKFADGTSCWTYSKTALDGNGQPKFPNDPAAGVGILLSRRAQDKYITHGSPCARITWVRLKCPVANAFIIVPYFPHDSRIKPAFQDTL